MATADMLRDVSLFRGLSDGELRGLASEVVQRRFTRNEMIFSQGERGDGLYVVVSGHVSINRQNADGDELILAVYEPGEYFGELSLFDEEARSASATAIDHAALLFLSRTAFRRFIGEHPAAVFACLQVIVRQFRRLTDLADEIALLDVRSRLARRLLRLAEQGVVDEGARSGPHSFHITQQQLANMLGATRESVNKHLSSFADLGIIALDRGRIRVLDRERLERCSEGML